MGLSQSSTETLSEDANVLREALLTMEERDCLDALTGSTKVSLPDESLWNTLLNIESLLASLQGYKLYAITRQYCVRLG